MKIISCTKGVTATVSDEDFSLVSQSKWSAKAPCLYGKIYLVAKIGGQVRYMHRVILGLERGDKRQVDHINGDTLDNRRENLRVVTAALNARNRQKHKTGTSAYKGVSRYPDSAQPWQASITIQGRRRWLGKYADETAAAEAYDLMARRHYGEYANLNFA